MTSQSTLVNLSSIDEERFGIRTARAFITSGRLNEAIGFCRANEVSLLIARCLVSDLKTAQAMEREGFLLMDTLVYYVRDLEKLEIPPDSGIFQIRPFRPGEENVVAGVAAESFRGYLGHYYADERLDRGKCDEVYASWALCSCLSTDEDHQVLLADIDGSVVGLAVLRLNNHEEGEGVLLGVQPSAQRRGVYRCLVIQSLAWCLSKGAKRMTISTQITNVAVQKVWLRVGFEPSHSYYTFHKWFS